MPTWTNRYAGRETPVGAGYYAFRENTSRSGRKYTKLVKGDRSPTIKLYGKGVPLTGHNERRQRLLDKRRKNGNS